LYRARKTGRQTIDDKAAASKKLYIWASVESSSHRRTVGILLQVVNDLRSCLTHRDLKSVVRAV